MTHQQRCLAYLRAYEQKNLADIAAMFADDIVLRDWKILVRGKEDALAETANNFAAAKSIEIQPLALYDSGDAVAAELKILVDGETELYVVDVLTFNPAGQIQSIRAYLGRGDDY